MILQTTKNKKEPLAHNTSVITPVVFCNFIVLLSQSTSWTCGRMHKKIENVFRKFSDLNPLISEIREINQQLLSGKRQLVA